MFEAIYDMRPTPPAAAARTGARRGPIAALAALGAFAVLFAPPAAEARSGPEGFSVLVAKVSPAVVNVSTTQKFETVAETMPPQFAFPPGSPFEEFSRRFFQTPGEGDSNGDHDGTPRRATALGSGFIIDPAGYVVTNNHVIGQAEKITVTLQGGDKFDAALIGRDAKTDLALLKIKSDKPLPFVSFGDSAQAQVGDWVIAVGNPFGLGGTVTAGIISARGRDIQSGPFDDFLQIDAPINRGNSGGPTFNTDGQVIGINSAIYSPNGGSVGIGFAIPASLAKPIVEQLRTHGSIDRGWLGVQIQPVTDEIANGLGLAKAQGALVSSIRDDGPAAKSGLEQGDVIVAVNGETVTQFKDLPRLIAAIKAGEKVRLAVWRGGAETTVNVVIGKMPQDEMAAAESDSPDGHGRPTKALGLALARLTPEARQRFRVDESVTGVLIANVQPGSYAAEQGLRPGDVIVKVGPESVAKPGDVVAKVKTAKNAKRDAVLFLINRRGNELYVALKTERAVG